MIIGYNKLDLKVSIITAVSIIIGLFLFENKNIFWFVLCVVSLGIINGIIIVEIMKDIIISKYNIFHAKFTLRKEKAE